MAQHVLKDATLWLSVPDGDHPSKTTISSLRLTLNPEHIATFLTMTETISGNRLNTVHDQLLSLTLHKEVLFFEPTQLSIPTISIGGILEDLECILNLIM